MSAESAKGVYLLGFRSQYAGVLPGPGRLRLRYKPRPLKQCFLKMTGVDAAPETVKFPALREPLAGQRNEHICRLGDRFR
jgi:hypothetical protein